MLDDTKHAMLCGDAVEQLSGLPEGSVHCCVTSPPYLGQRDYGGGAGEIGRESPQEYLEALTKVFAEVRRVLRDDGTLWLNMGDKVIDGGLYGMPWGLAWGLVADGWVLKQDIIWHKPSPMPAACPGRCTPAHEYVFLLTKRPAGYYFDAVAIEEPAAHGGTKNRRSVWTVASTPFAGAHFATMPTTLASLCIQAGSSEGACPACGAPWRRIVDRVPLTRERPNEFVKRRGKAGTGNSCPNTVAGVEKRTVAWEAGCYCGGAGPVIPVPCAVLDPFGGSGTTSVVAKSLGRNSVYIDLNPEYVAMARERLELSTKENKA